MQTTQRALDPTPPRPDHPVATPAHVVRLRVEVHAAHLANPLVAVARLLASEAGALARVTGDEAAFEVAVAASPAADTSQIEAWVRWAVHNAGVRGQITRIG